MNTAPARLGKYNIVRALGSGAMGIVYEAVDPVIERSVAIKTILNDGLDPDEAAEHARRFLVEAKAAGKLNHPNIVGLYDHGNEDGLAYIVMERVQGRELQHWFDEGHRFALPEVLRLMGELLDALGYSHRRGVIHRDVKPGNIFVTDEGQLKLGDFGIARIESTHKTRLGSALGTPSHMAPEQIRGEAVDARADLYAAGVVLFQLLTGQRPFSGPMLSLSLKVLNDPAPAPSSLRPDLPPSFDALLRVALAKRPEDRFATAAAFWRALAEAAGGGGAGLPLGRGEGGGAFGPSGFGPSGFGPRDAWPAGAAPSAPIQAPARVRMDRSNAAQAHKRRLGWALAASGLAVGTVAAGGWWLAYAPAAIDPASATTSRPTVAAVPEPGPSTTRSGAPSATAPPSIDGPTPITTPGPAPAPEGAPPLATSPAPPGARPAAPAQAPPAASRRPDAAPVRITAERAASPPKPSGHAAARCSDILQKASLEPLTSEEAAYLRSQCR